MKKIDKSKKKLLIDRLTCTAQKRKTVAINKLELKKSKIFLLKQHDFFLNNWFCRQIKTVSQKNIFPICCWNFVHIRSPWIYPWCIASDLIPLFTACSVNLLLSMDFYDWEGSSLDPKSFLPGSFIYLDFNDLWLFLVQCSSEEATVLEIRSLNG